MNLLWVYGIDEDNGILLYLGNLTLLLRKFSSYATDVYVPLQIQNNVDDMLRISKPTGNQLANILSFTI